MPTTYTHYRFGQEVLARLDEKTATIIRNYKELYDSGLHGPDLLFYYHALRSNDVVRLGNRLHDLPGKVFFENALSVLEKAPHPGPSLAYLYGFLCHFALDRRCHAYIEPYVLESGVSHLSLEAELDRHFLLKDGKDPFQGSLTRHVVPRKKNAAVIATFFAPLTGLIYGEVSPTKMSDGDSATPMSTIDPASHDGFSVGPKEISVAMRSFRFYLDILVCRTRLKRNTLLGLLGLIGAQSYRDLIIREIPDPRCEKSNRDLEGLYLEAIGDAVRLIQGFGPLIKKKAASDVQLTAEDWDPLYTFDFGGNPH